ncbi:MAG TPA: four-carbon acid sugar kinase family protein, partial [Negativicutes bacterium]|nr:four-carbon acid sugar kinase family protein [Negativicutes bacterium]
AGVQFVKHGLKVQVFLGGSVEGEGERRTDALVLDTDSRAAQPDISYERVRNAGRIIKQVSSARPLVFKKIDSTLRGNLGAEIDAAMAEFDFEWAAVAPAFPVNGRITVGGWHLLHQVPIAESEISRDPKTPVYESLLPTLLATQSHHKVEHVYLADVCKGVNAVMRRIKEIRQDGAKVVSFDASTQTHLQTIATAIAATEAAALWVGSAGLAEVIPAVMGWPQAEQTVTPGGSGPVLVVAGSVSYVTARQMNRFLTGDNVHLVSLQVDALISHEAEEVQRCAQEALSQLAAGRDVLLASAVAEGSVVQGCSEIVAASMGKVVAQLASEKLAGLFLTGGDTAVSVCRALGVNAIDILAEVLPGIPLGQLNGGCCPGLRVVTKAGAFGGENAIVEAVKVLKGRTA